MPFSSLNLAAPILRALAERGYQAATPVQAEAIPAILRGGDVLLSAPTGSGKTAAFVLPVLQALGEEPPSKPRRLRALILAPTRELVVQIQSAITGYGKYLPVPPKTVAVFGGVSANPQMMALRGGADIVVATPGRLLDLVEQNALRLSSLATLILDEADRLLALGFADELERVLALLPAGRQNVLCSATFPPGVSSLAGRILRDPVHIRITEDPGPEGPAIEQRVIEVDVARRTPLLRRLIEDHKWEQTLVFVATKYGADHVAGKLLRAGITAAALHGELSQSARTQNLADFKAKKTAVLVATDVAARGLDIVQLPCVVNYDLPRSPVDYTHRIGRTGRAGEPGVAISFVTADSAAHFRLIEKKHQLRLTRERIPGFEPVEVASAAPLVDPEIAATGGVKGHRKSKKDKLREAAALLAAGQEKPEDKGLGAKEADAVRPLEDPQARPRPPARRALPPRRRRRP
jgi:superfamily II DNA/RNA helicase